MGSGKSREINLITKLPVKNDATNKNYTKPKGSYTKINVLSEEINKNSNLAFHKISKHGDEPVENLLKKNSTENIQKDLEKQEEDSEAKVIVNGKSKPIVRDSIIAKTLPPRRLPPISSGFEISAKMNYKPDMKLIHDLLSRETECNFEEYFIEENNEEVGNDTLISILNELTN